MVLRSIAISGTGTGKSRTVEFKEEHDKNYNNSDKKLH